MPGCVLRVSGPYSDLAASLGAAFVEFEESRATARLRERGEATTADDATFNYVVSEADGDHVPQQVRDAEAFLNANREAMTELRDRSGVESATLDFGWDVPRDAAGQWNRFSLPLLALCAELRIEIEASVYLVAEREEPR